MPERDWMLDVIRDLQSFACSNEMPLSAKALAQISEIVEVECSEAMVRNVGFTDPIFDLEDSADTCRSDSDENSEGERIMIKSRTRFH